MNSRAACTRSGRGCPSCSSVPAAFPAISWRVRWPSDGSGLNSLKVVDTLTRIQVPILEGGVMRGIKSGLTLAVAALAVAGLPATANASAPAWWSYGRSADYTTVTSNVFVPVRDGTLIHCVLAQPADNGAAAPGKFPGLVESYTPYGAVNLQAQTADDYWADHGYAAMTCDVRGTGESGGVWQGLLSEQENQDNYDVLAWMRKQPWCDGRLGQLGASYGGMTSMRVAALHPPGLLAISPISSEYDLYMEDIYPGGIKSTPGTGDYWPFLTTAISGGREIAAETEAQYLEHPLWDSFWQQIAVSTKWSQINIPILGISAWNDVLVPGGGPANWIGLQNTGNPQNYLIVGPWGHAQTGAPAPLPAGAQLAWFDHWLMQLPGAPLPTSAVTSFEEPTGVLDEGNSATPTPTQLPAGEDSGHGWQSYTTWPPPGTRQQSWALTQGDQIATVAGVAGKQSYTTYPTDSGYTGIVDNGSVSPTAQKLVFNTAPLTQDLLVAGSIVVNLRASLSYSDGNLKALAYDVAPNGAATFIQEGYLKASHRLSQGRAVPVTPGVVTSLPIQIFPMDWRFAKGHELRILIYGGESTELVPEPVPVTTTVSLGAGGSTVSLPIQ